MTTNNNMTPAPWIGLAVEVAIERTQNINMHGKRPMRTPVNTKRR